MAKDTNDWDRKGLPAWAYHSEAIYALEQERLFRRHWQIAGHLSDIPEPGDYVTLDIAGERALVVRGHDGVPRAFHNICRHRGTRVVTGETGRCNKAIVCPFHGWAYNLDGTLRGKDGARYGKHAALALETAHLPDAVHHASFPQIFLRPGETYRQTCIYRFSVESP